MSIGISLSAQLAALYANYLDKTFERWQVLLQEARASKLTADHVATDAVLQTADYLELMAFPIVAFRTPQTFVVTFTFTTADDKSHAEIPFPDLGYKPKASALLPPSGGPPTIPNSSTNMDVDYDKSTRLLKIDLKNLKALSLKTDTYGGSLSNPSNPSEIVGRIIATVS